MPKAKRIKRRQRYDSEEGAYHDVEDGWGAPFRTVLNSIAHAATQPGGVHIIDCGSNDGAWLRAILAVLKETHGVGYRGVYPVWIEPQPRFKNRLSESAAAAPHGRYIEAAAWNRNTSLEFYVSHQSAASSAVRSSAGRYSLRSRVNVRAFDLAEYIERLGRNTTIVMKMDIESAEYVVLPHLIGRGLLCSIGYLRLEWHLNGNPPHQRLPALGLQIAMPALLAGCPSPVHYEQQSDNNMNRAKVNELAGMSQFFGSDEYADTLKRVKKHWIGLMNFTTLAWHTNDSWAEVNGNFWYPSRVTAGG